MPKRITVEQLLERLQLKPLPVEGGYFRETYRSAESTAIYFLLTPDSFSALHRLRTDEVYHYYLGDPVELLTLGPDGGRSTVLGSDVLAGQVPQLIVPGGIWQGSRLTVGGEFALMGTTMAPPFDFAHFELGNRETLTNEYPAFAEAIRKLTRVDS